MIKAIFFDFDGVLTPDKTGRYTTCTYISKKTGIELDKLLSCYKKYNKDLNLGKITHEAFWSGFCKCIDKEIDINILEEAFLSTPINKDMFDLAEKLRDKYKVGIITDNNKKRLDLLTEKLKLNDLFDAVILSADIGGKKNDTIIFEEALKSLGVNSEDCIFIDNKLKNLDAPKSMGFKTIYYDDEKNDISLLIRELKDLGIDV